MRKFTLLLCLLLCGSLLTHAAHIVNRYGMILIKDENGKYMLRDYDLLLAKVPFLDQAPGLLVPWNYEPEKILPEALKKCRTISVVYKKYDNYQLDLKIDLPLNASHAPVFYFIHGGGYANGDNSQFEKQAKYFASQGIAVVRPAYSLDNKTHKANFDKTISDLKDAIIFVKEHASEYGLDASRFGFGGISAGAHLASYMALTTPGARFAVPMAGFADMTAEQQRLGRRPYFSAYFPGKERLISPLHLAKPDSPAFMIIQGSGDHVLMMEHSLLLYWKLQELGVESHLLLYPFLVHNIPAVNNIYYEDYMLRMHAFLNEHLQ